LLKGELMKKRVYNVDVLMKGGPYSRIAEAGGFLFMSGIVPRDIEKGLMITDDIKKLLSWFLII
jgi:enamine deaminase RidA (YjgF/YER057c/UK114 family)